MILIFSAAILMSATAAEAANGQRMIQPVHGKINLPFGVPNPFTNGKKHTGIDIDGSRGTIIRAPSSGRVMAVGWGSLGEGHYVVILHKPGDYNLSKKRSPVETWTKYYHLDMIYVKKYQWVLPGQSIGTMGDTGNASGVHLHFEVIENGRYATPLNPQEYVKLGLAAPRKNSGQKTLATTWGSMKQEK